MSSRSLVVVLIGVAVVSTPMSAQLCAGRPSFARHPYHAFSHTVFGHAGRTLAGGLTFGEGGVFGEIGLGTTRFDDWDASSLSFAGAAGSQFSIGDDDLVHVCPGVSVDFGFGPNDLDVFGGGDRFGFRERDVAVGAALGVVVYRSRQVQIIPTASLNLVSANARMKNQRTGAVTSVSDEFGLYGLGVGVLVKHAFALRPTISVPFGIRGATAVFAFTLSVGLGQRSR